MLSVAVTSNTTAGPMLRGTVSPEVLRVVDVRLGAEMLISGRILEMLRAKGLSLL